MKITKHPFDRRRFLKAGAASFGALGLGSVEGVRQGKLFEIEIGAEGEAEARSVTEQVAEKLLANPVIEDWEIIRIG